MSDDMKVSKGLEFPEVALTGVWGSAFAGRIKGCLSLASITNDL